MVFQILDLLPAPAQQKRGKARSAIVADESTPFFSSIRVF
jgi:hypothetical protein